MKLTKLLFVMALLSIISSLKIMGFTLVSSPNIEISQNNNLNPEVQNFIDVLVQIHKDTAIINFPQNGPVRIRSGRALRVKVSLQYFVEETIIGDFNLLIQAPHTTLVPVKIPPRRPPDGKSTVIRDWYSEFIYGQPIEPGISRATFTLQTCECPGGYPIVDPNGTVVDQKSFSFEVLPDADLIFQGIDVGIYQDQLYLEYYIFNNGQNNVNQRFTINFYASSNNSLDTNDLLISSYNKSGLESFQYHNGYLSHEQLNFQNFTPKFIIAVLDIENIIQETSETNNTAVITVPSYQDLIITNVNIEPVYSAFWQPITFAHCTIKNIGNMDIDVPFYVELFSEDFLYEPYRHQPIYRLQANKEINISFPLKGLTDSGGVVEINVDYKNVINELNENNNTHSAFVPIIYGLPYNYPESKNNPITPYPNPFSDKLFFTINDEIDDLNLKIYNSAGILVESLQDMRLFKKDKKLIQIDTDKLPSGVYYYHLKMNNQENSGTLLKSNQ